MKELTVKFVPRYTRIVFIGCGGTGGYLIPSIARMISHIPHTKPMIHLYDHDIIEEKNCARQNFSFLDVGKHKAEVLAGRYSAAFGIPISYNNSYFVPNVFSSRSQKTLIIDTVDNLKTRFEIDNLIKGNKNIDWLSIGNTDVSGQMIFTCRELKINDSLVTLFPEVFTPASLKAEEEALARTTCAMNAVSIPQSLAINLTGASLATNFLYELYYDNTISYTALYYNRHNVVSMKAVVEETIKKAKKPSLLDSLQAQTV